MKSFKVYFKNSTIEGKWVSLWYQFIQGEK